jgi:hypothetical protein
MGCPGLFHELHSYPWFLDSLDPSGFLAPLESGPIAAIIVFIGIVLINGFDTHSYW